MLPSPRFACMIFCAFALLSYVQGYQSSIVMAFIVRDEAVNIRANLPLWFDSVDYYVFMVDYRTQDDTYKAIAEVLEGKKQYRNITYDFTGFGPARTASLEAAWEHFPQATHVWIADPDWRPEVDTIKLEQLDFLQRVVPQAEAFRFKIYDRNGFSTRNCDWLLKHRKGLKMKYHLHETIDIGIYQHVAVDFVLHEIEKPGTWHTTVGHGNSMTGKRSLFDLDMLYKDLALYDHDPHTHYYLGVTHEHVATQNSRAGLWGNETEWHYEMALKFMNLRLRSYYNNEFTEERWGVMLALSQLLREYKGDIVLAEYWQQACRSLSPHQIDCSMALVRTYLSVGSLAEATRLLVQILQVERKDRIMLNHFRLSDCDLPVYILELFGYNSMSAGAATSTSAETFNDLNHAKYALHAIAMARREKCEGPHQAYQITEGGVLMDYAKTGFRRHGIEFSYATLQEDAKRLCLDTSFRDFLQSTRYTLHTCEDLKKQMQKQDLCKPFNTFPSAAFEDYQIMGFGEFVGAAVLPDVVHHVYGGDMSLLLSPGSLQWRVLFAEHFNEKLLYSLVGSVSRPPHQSIVVELELVVLTPSAQVREAIRVAMEQCALNEGVRVSVQFVEASLADLMKYDELTMTKYRGYFNYIEYYGGSGDAATVGAHLTYLREMLCDTGVVGFSHFTENVHVDTLRRMLERRNERASIPFSEEGERLVQGYLTYTRDLAAWNTDKTLIKYLSTCHQDTAELFFSPPEVVELVEGTGLKIRSWVPTAYSHPYDELPHYQIQQFYDYGVQSEDFVHSTLFTFRKTVYLSRTDSTRANAPGTGRASVESFEAYVVNDRTNMTAENSFDAAVADGIMVVDRSGYLGSLLRQGREFAERGSTMNMGLVFHAAPQFNFTISYQPSTLHGLSLFGMRPTLSAMLGANVAAMVTAASARGEEPSASDLLKSHWGTLDMLSFFEKLNLVTFIWSNKAPFLAKRAAGRRKIDRYTKVKSRGSAAAMLAMEEDAEIPFVPPPVALALKSAPPADTSAKAAGGASSKGKSPVDYLKKTLKGKKRTEGSAAGAASQATAEAEVGVTGSGTPSSAASSDLDAKMAQLRAMGISESVIAQTVAQLSGAKPSATAAGGAQSATPSATAAGGAQSATPAESAPEVQKVRSELKDVSGKGKGKKKAKGSSRDDKSRKPAKQKSGPSFVPKVLSRQTKEQLLAGRRDPACMAKGGPRADPHCQDMPSPGRNRVSAELTSVSAMKVRFDLAQLRYIALVDTLNAPAIVAKVLPKLQNVNKLINNFLKYTALAATKQSFHLTDSEVATLSDGALNRALHLAKDPHASASSAASKAPVLYEEAKRSLTASDLDVGEADFLVLDLVVNMATLRSMGTILLTSTVWFDCTNGQAVAAHHDDGLVHKIFPKFVKEVAETLKHSYPYHVRRYLALAMDLSSVEQYFSPLFMAEEDELAVVVWVNPNAVPADDDAETDGLFVFDTLAFDALPNEAAHVNPSVHPDFLTDSGQNFSTADQAVSTELQSELFKSAIPRELIQRHSNRLVLVPPRRPFFFSTSNRVDGAYKETLGRKAFDQKTMIAMVIFLGKP